MDPPIKSAGGKEVELWRRVGRIAEERPAYGEITVVPPLLLPNW